MTEQVESRLYLPRPFDLQHKSRVTRVRIKKNNCRIWLEASLLEPSNPEGGDRGRILGKAGSLDVAKVVWDNTERTGIHVGSLSGALEEGEEVFVTVDEMVRRRNSVYHSASHLLTSIAKRRWRQNMIGKLKLNPQGGVLVLYGQASRAGDVLEVCAEAMMYLGRSVPVQICYLPAEVALDQCGRYFADVVQAGLTEWRVVKFADTEFPPIPCGGVHVSDLQIIQAVSLKNEEVVGEDLHVHYECGYGAL
jgi:Ser-tRNA(Ala) deacylase AlaX